MLIVHQMTAMKVSDGNRLVFVPEIESTEKKGILLLQIFSNEYPKARFFILRPLYFY